MGAVQLDAVQFIQRFGIERTKELLNAEKWTMGQICMFTYVADVKALQRAVECHNYIERLGGLDQAKLYRQSVVDEFEQLELDAAIHTVSACNA